MKKLICSACVMMVMSFTPFKVHGANVQAAMDAWNHVEGYYNPAIGGESVWDAAKAVNEANSAYENNDYTEYAKDAAKAAEALKKALSEEKWREWQ